MPSLTEAYEGNEREVTSLRRLYAGTAFVVVGALLAVVAVLVATTDLFAGYVAGATSWEMADQYATVRVAGALAGIGVPAALLGVFVVLPSGRRVRAAAVIGAGLCLLGTVLFWDAYPSDWRGHGADLTLEVSAIYLAGLFVALWCLFVGVVNFKTRNDPGGMLEMNVTRRNQTVVEVEEDSSGGAHGGVGLLGGTPDGEVETQTNDAEETTLSSGASTTDAGVGPQAGAVTSDGGSAAADISSPLEGGDGQDAEIVGSSTDSPGEHADTYCGNCRHFEYVRSSEGMVPYCGSHDEAMEDMDACEAWTPNRSGSR